MARSLATHCLRCCNRLQLFKKCDLHPSASLLFHQKSLLSSLPYKHDRYNGVHIDLTHNHFKSTSEQFELLLKGSLAEWEKTSCSAAWLKIPIEQSHLIPAAYKAGFLFHHAEGNYSMLCKWLSDDIPSKLPRFATHQVGVAGCVVKEDTNEILVVRDRNRPFTLWKFPGGLSDLGEDISTTAEREVYEETGVKSEFRGVLTFRQQHNQPGAYGRSDFYFLCLMHPVTFDINPCAHEIEAAEWMDLTTLANHSETSAITLRVLQLIRRGLDQESFQNICLTTEEFKSVYKGLKYKLYHTTLPEGSELKNYLHNVS